MINRIAAFFNEKIQPPEAPEEHREERIRLATAALLTEVMMIDGRGDNAERDSILALLDRHFGLTTEQSRELVAMAGEEVEEATSLYQFTDLVNRFFSVAEKEELMISLWKVAFADGSLDKHEEATIRKIAELIHVPHSAFIRAKHHAR
jgi:uncharacterized tellurite resistance protein B-like protein